MEALWVYLHTIATALSILLNAIIGGQPTETLSYRAATAREKKIKWGCVLCRVLDSIDHNHCDKALKWWREVNGRL